MRMSWGRWLIAGLVVAIFNAIYGFVTCGWLFNWVYELPPTEIWRNMENITGIFWVLVNLGNFVVALIYTFIYAQVGACIAGSKGRKGTLFGLALWFVALLPGMFYTYAFMSIASGVVIYWLIQGLVQLVINGLLIAWIYPLGEHACCCKSSS